jgi:acyl-CoA synthetase (AMP-forming)/AMP-acid ligase II
VPHETDGEVPKAFVVKAPTEDGKSEEAVTEEIHKHVQDHKAHYKWLKGGIEYVESIAKTPSGKILRRLLREKEREARRKNGGKL